MNRGRAGGMAGKHSALLVPSGNEIASYDAARIARVRPTIRRDVRYKVAAGITRDGIDRDRTARVDVLRRNNGPASIDCGFNPHLGRRAQSDVERIASHRGQAGACRLKCVAGATLLMERLLKVATP